MPTIRKNRIEPVHRLILGLILIFALLFISHSSALAHKVYIYAWLEGDTVYTESYFGAKKKVKQGLVRVFDLTGKKLLEGRTNEQGEFVFKPPSLIDLRIEIEAGMGHKGAFVLKAEESSVHSGPETIHNVTGEDEELASGPISAGEEQIRMIVEQVLDARLKPVMRELVEIRKEKGPGFIEIIGGIGYILGIMGLILYFKTREKNGDQ